jgi:hypothetical protein
MEVIFNNEKLWFLYQEGRERENPIYGEAVGA